MNRLTRYIGDRAASAGDMGDLKFVRLVIDHLAAYEDTRLEPSEIPTGLDMANIFAAMRELKRYKDAEEQGLLVRLPCNVGDIVYIIANVFNGKDTLRNIGTRIIDRIGGNALNPIWMVSSKPYELHFTPSEFGKTLFLTREAAEAALAKNGRYSEMIGGERK